jgi:hypothetical protein
VTGSSGRQATSRLTSGYDYTSQATAFRKGGWIGKIDTWCVNIWFSSKQIINPASQYEFNEKSVTSGDYTFTAKQDGKFAYCFGNQHWNANSKEVSFNVHGVVYVNEADMPSDPLEKESTYKHPRVLYDQREKLT